VRNDADAADASDFPDEDQEVQLQGEPVPDEGNEADAAEES
jgi:hypothetical protein